VIERKYDEKTEKYKKEIVVDDARQLGDFLRLTPAESTHRVAIVDSADELNTQAANALLKLVEEPPKRSVIILLSHGGHILPTIRSRCISIKLKSLSKDDMRRVMEQTIPGISDQDMDLLAIISEGSPGIAKEIYENDGLWILAELIEIIQGLPHYDYPKLTKFAERVAKSGKGWDIFCHAYELLLTNLAKAAAKGEVFAIGDTEIAASINLPLLLSGIDEWNQTRTNCEIYNLDNKQVIVNELMRISSSF
jgi:DNA polymerase-3 subunit delta'